MNTQPTPQNSLGIVAKYYSGQNVEQICLNRNSKTVMIINTESLSDSLSRMIGRQNQ